MEMINKLKVENRFSKVALLNGACFLLTIVVSLFFVTDADCNIKQVWISKVVTSTGDIGRDVKVDPLGNVYAVGQVGVPANGTSDGWIGKYDRYGNIVLSITYNGDMNLSDSFNSVALATGYVVGGVGPVICVSGTEQKFAGSGGNDVIIGSYDGVNGAMRNVEKVWGRQGVDDEALGITAHASEYTWVTGYSSSSSQSKFLFVRKTGIISSDFRLFHAYDQPQNVALDEQGNAVGTDGMGNVYVAGFQTGVNSGRDILVLQYNHLNDHDLTRTRVNFYTGPFDGAWKDDEARGIYVEENGNCYVAGHIVNSSILGNIALWVAKFNTNGDLVWVDQRLLDDEREGGSYEENYGDDVVLDPNGNVYVTGHVINRLSNNQTESSMFISKYDSNGLLQLTTTFNILGKTVPKGMAADKFGNLYLTGYFIEDFDNRREDLFVAKYTQDFDPPEGHGILSHRISQSSVVVVLKNATDTINGLHENPYWIDISTDPSFVGVSSSTFWISQTTWTFPLIDGSTNYYLRMKARDDVFNETNFVLSTTIQPPPGFKGTAISTTAIRWEWSEMDNEDGYCLKRTSDNSVIANLPANSTFFIQSFLLPNTSQSIFMEAFNSVESSRTASSALFTLANPPAGTVTTSVTSSSIVVSWSSSGNPSATVDEAQISTDLAFSYINMATTTALSTAFINLMSNATYYVRVRAKNGDNIFTDFDAIVSTKTLFIDQTPPFPIGDLSVSEIGTNSVKLLWTASGDDDMEGKAAKYDIRYLNVPINEGNFENAIEVPQNIDPLPAYSPEFCPVTNLQPMKDYYFAIKSIDNAGNKSGISNVVHVKTLPLVSSSSEMEILLEELDITKRNSANPAISSVQLDPNKKYVIEGRGLWTPWTVQPCGADYYGTFDPVYVSEGGCSFNSPSLHKLVYMNDSPAPWTEVFNPSHFYRFPITGVGGNLSFYVNDGGPGDNSGNLYIRIFEVAQSQEPVITFSASVGTTIQRMDAVDPLISDMIAIAEVNQQLTLASAVYDISPHGTNFETPATLTMSYDPNIVKNPNQLAIYKWDQGKWVTDPIEDQQVDSVNYKVTGKVYSISYFALFEPDTVPPSKIENLQAIPGNSAGSVVLSWQAPGDDGREGKVTAYDIRYLQTPISDFSVATPITQPPIPQFGGIFQTVTIPNLTPGVTYYFAIRSVDESGNLSEVSNSTSARATPSDDTGPTTDLVFINGKQYEDISGTIYVSSHTEVSFLAVDPIADGYASGIALTEFTVDTQTYTVSITTFAETPPVISFQPGSHAIGLKSLDKAGNWESTKSKTIIVDAVPPAKIEDLHTENPTGSSLDLVWTSPGDDGAAGILAGECKWKIVYSTNASLQKDSKVVEIPASASPGEFQNFTITGLYAGYFYFFSVQTVDKVKNISEWSNVATGETLLVPVAPFVPSLVSPSYSSLLNIVQPAFIFSQSDANITDNVKFVLEISKAQNFSTIVLSFTSSLIAQGMTNFIPDAPLSEGSYFWRVKTIDETGRESGFSAPFSLRIDTSPPVVTIVKPPEGSTPNTLSSFLRLSFSELSNVHDIFIDGNPQQVTCTPANSLGAVCSISGTLSQEIHFLQVRATDLVGNLSGPATVSFVLDSFPPDPVTDLRAFAGPQDGQIRLEWTASGDDGTAGMSDVYVVEYGIFPRILPDFGTNFYDAMSHIAPANKNPGEKESLIIEGLTPGDPLLFHIRCEDEAGNSSGYSALSDAIVPGQPAQIIPSPDLISPIDGREINVDQPSMRFVLYGDLASYRVQISTNRDFSSPVVDAYYPRWNVDETSTSYKVGEWGWNYLSGQRYMELSDGNYYWRVMAIGFYGLASPWVSANGGNVAFKLNKNLPYSYVTAPKENSSVNGVTCIAGTALENLYGINHIEVEIVDRNTGGSTGFMLAIGTVCWAVSVSSNSFIHNHSYRVNVRTVYEDGSTGLSVSSFKVDTSLSSPDIVNFIRAHNVGGYPFGVAVDNAGDIYVANIWEPDNYIQIFDSAGDFITKYGSSGMGVGQFREPIALSVDLERNIYVVDSVTNKLQKISRNGNVLSFAWEKTLPFFVIDVAVDNRGSVYVIGRDYEWIGEGNRIIKYDTNGNHVTEWETRGVSIAVDSYGDIFVAGNPIKQFNSSGKLLKEWFVESFAPKAIALDSKGYIYAAASTPDPNSPGQVRILKLDNARKPIASFGDFQNNNGNIRVGDIATDNEGNIYVTDTEIYKIMKFNSPIVDIEPPRASVVLSSASPLRAGEVGVTLYTSELLSSTPTLHYVVSGGASSIEVNLQNSDGKGIAWKSTMNISPLTGDGVATFSWQGTDLVGNTGDSILYGKTFTIDANPPQVINDLSISFVHEGKVKLEWHAPSDTGSGKASSYDIRLATFPIDTEESFVHATSMTVSIIPGNAGSLETVFVERSFESAAFYFALKSKDAAGNISQISNQAVIDLCPPAKVVDLNVIASTVSSLTLSWTAPGDDGTSGWVKKYDLRYSLVPILTETDFLGATQIVQIPAFQQAGSSEIFLVTGLAGDTTYYFALKAVDEVGNVSEISNCAVGKTLDLLSPSKVQLEVRAGFNPVLSHFVELKWTAPGDNGTSGQAARYDLRYSLVPIETETGFLESPPVSGIFNPQNAGSPEVLVLTGLSRWKIYYFALKTFDEMENASVMSDPVEIELFPPSEITDLSISSRSASSLTLSWTVPGDDGTSGQAARYDLRYSMVPILTEIDFLGETSVTQVSSPQYACTLQTFSVSGLAGDTTYYLALKTEDDVGNLSEISNKAIGKTIDIVPPSAVQLVVVPEYDSILSHYVELKWISPGDNGNIGTASRYDIRYSTKSIEESGCGLEDSCINFGSAKQIARYVLPQLAGSPESVFVTGLTKGATYFFALKSVDDDENISLMTVVSTQTIGIFTSRSYSREVLVEELRIDDNGISNPKRTQEPLELGATYFIEGRGIYRVQQELENPTVSKDCAFTSNEKTYYLTSEFVDPYRAVNTHMNGVEPSWGNIYNPDHVYRFKYIGEGEELTFDVNDTDVRDNVGPVVIRIYKVVESSNPTVSLAADVPTIIKIASFSDFSVALSTAEIHQGLHLVSPIYEIGPHGTQFEQPATLTIAYDSTTVTDPSKLKIYKWNGTQWDSLQIASQVVNSTNHTISGQVASISLFGIFGPDDISPVAVNTLKAVPDVLKGTVILSWISPGDDDKTGTVSNYDIRYSLSPIYTDDDFNGAISLAQPPVPLIADSYQSIFVKGLNPETTYYFALKSTDESGNVSPLSNIAVVRTYPEDTTPPLTTLNILGGKQFTNGEERFIASPDTVISFDAVDPLVNGFASGLRSLEFSIDGSSSTIFISSMGIQIPPLYLEEGIHDIFYRSKDRADNLEETHSRTIFTDVTPPCSRLEFEGSSFTLNNDVIVNPGTKLHLSAEDPVVEGVNSGLKEIKITMDGMAFSVMQSTTILISEGIHTVDVQSVDMVGNLEEIKSVVIKVDAVSPMVSFSKGGNPLGESVVSVPNSTIDITASDPVYGGVGSGIYWLEMSIDGGAFSQVYQASTTFVVDLSSGVHFLTARAIDKVGNKSAEKTLRIVVQTVVAALPGTMQWNLTSHPMSAPRYNHTATLLPDGRVLVAGGHTTGGQALQTAEIYDPKSNSWTNTMPMSYPRTFHTATLLQDGRVLIAGGAYDLNARKSSEIYDPNTNSWSQPVFMNDGRVAHGAIRLEDGQVLVMGGYSSPGNPNPFLSSCEIFNPAGNSWTLTGPMNKERAILNKVAVLLSDGRVMVLVADGQGSVGDLKSAEIYNPDTGQWTYTVGSMNYQHDYGTLIMLPNGKALIVGGSGGSISPSETYDHSSGMWSPTGPMGQNRSGHTATLLLSGKVLAAAGMAGNWTGTDSAELYEPSNDMWTGTNPLSVPRIFHTATLLSDGDVLVVGGYDQNNVPLASAEIFDAATGIDSNAPANIGNLSGRAVSSASVELSWTAVGDDGTVGRAAAYDLRFGRKPIISEGCQTDECVNFADAKFIAGVPVPKAAGSAETVSVDGLESGVTYYFALKVIDDAGNVSGLSNVAPARTFYVANSTAQVGGFPEVSFMADLPITVTLVSTTSSKGQIIMGTATLQGFKQVSNIYELGPDGALFNPPAVITFRYDEAQIPTGVLEAQLKLYEYKSGTGQLEEVVGQVINIDENKITVMIANLASIFVILAPPVDTTAPVSELHIEDGPMHISEGNVYVSTGSRAFITVVDPIVDHTNTGVDFTEFRIGTSAYTRYISPLLFFEGIQTVEYRSQDKKGNLEIVRSTSLRVDGTAPTINTELSGKAVNIGAMTFISSNTLITVVSTDPVSNGVASGVKELSLALDGHPSSVPTSISGFSALSSPFTFSEGSHTVSAESKDFVENINFKLFRFSVDSTPPNVILTQKGSVISLGEGVALSSGSEIIIKGDDQTFSGVSSGIDYIAMSVDGGPFSQVYQASATFSVNFISGAHFLTVRAVDRIGNRSADRTLRIVIVTEVGVKPGTMQWNLTSHPMNAPRYNHTATLLPDGRVLVAGGHTTGGQALQTAEIYDPKSSSWTNTMPMSYPRTFHTATLLQDGRVLIAGGAYDLNARKSSEIYDPNTNSWSQPVFMNDGRVAHGAIRLEDGQVLVMGGYSSPGNPNPFLSSCEIFNPAGNSWTLTGPMNKERAILNKVAVLLSDGRVMVLVADGQGSSEDLKSAEIYNPDTRQWTYTVGGMNSKHDYGTLIMLPNGKALIVGGNGDSISPSETYDHSSGMWSPTGPMGRNRSGHTATLLLSGKVLAAAGMAGNWTGTDSAELYEPANDMWTGTNPLSVPRIFHTATLLSDGDVLVVGGYDQNNVPLASAEIFDAATGIDSNAPANIGNLSGRAVSSASVELSWTAVGDDGTVGRAAAYDLRFGRKPIVDGGCHTGECENFSDAKFVAGLSVPKTAGSTETVSIDGLESGVTYYFALKVIDYAGNMAGLSSVAPARTFFVAQSTLPLANGAPEVTFIANKEISVVFIDSATSASSVVIETATTQGLASVSNIYELGPEGATFDPPAVIVFRYDESNLPEGVLESELRIFEFVPGTGLVEMPNQVVDTEKNEISFTISQLSSIFVILVPTDNTPPETNLVVVGSSTTINNQLFISSLTHLSFVSTDPAAGRIVRGVDFTEFRIDGSTESIRFAGAFTLEEGVHEIFFRARDKAGNWETLKSSTVKVDVTQPQSHLTVGSPQLETGAGVIIGSKTPITIIAEEIISNNVASGLKELWIKIDDSTPTVVVNMSTQSVVSSSFTLSGGSHTVSFYSTDNVGNLEIVRSSIVIVDVELPRVAIGSPSGGEKFVAMKDKIRIDFSVTDNFDPAPSSSAFLALVGSPVAIMVTDGQEIEPLSIPAGFWTLTVSATDFTGNFVSTTTASFEVLHDTLPPRTALTIDGPNVTIAGQSYVTSKTTFSLSAVDDMLVTNDGAGLGVEKTLYALDTANFSDYVAPLTLAEGIHTLKFLSKDIVGNSESEQSLTVGVDNTAPISQWNLMDGNRFEDSSGKIYLSAISTISITSEDPVISGAGSGLQSVQYSIDGGGIGLYSSPFSLKGGIRTIEFTGKDNIGNEESTKTVTLHMDGSAPISDIALSSPPVLIGTMTFIRGDTRLEVISHDPLVEGVASGFRASFYSIDDSLYELFVSSLTLSEGSRRLSFYSNDNVLNRELTQTREYKVDATSPSVTLSFTKGLQYMPNDSCPLCSLYASENTEFKFEVEDTTSSGLRSGAKQMELSIDTAPFTLFQATYAAVAPLLEGSHLFRYHGEDRVGNVSVDSIVVVNVDKTPPLTQLHITGEQFLNEGKMYVNLQTAFNFSAQDQEGNGLASGVKETRYRVNGGEFRIATSSFTLPQGIHTVEYFSGDNVGNGEPIKSITLYVDATPPVTEISISSPTFTAFGINYISPQSKISFAAEDLPVSGVASGVQKIEFRVTGTYPTGDFANFTHYTAPITIAQIIGISTGAGEFTIEYRSKDNVSNVENTKTKIVSVNMVSDLALTGIESVIINGKSQVLGNVRSNGDVRLVGQSKVNGSIYGSAVTLVGQSTATGQVVENALHISSIPIDLVAIASAVIQSNNNNLIPNSQKNNDPLDENLIFKLTGNDSITLSSGNYYFKGMEIAGGSILNLSGHVNIYCEGDVKLSGGSKFNSKDGAGNIFDLTIFVDRTLQGGTTVTVAGQSQIAGTIYAPYSSISVDGESKTYGALFGLTAQLNGQASVSISTETPVVTVVSGGGSKGGKGAPSLVTQVGGPDPTFRLGEVYSFPNPAVGGKNPTIHVECGIADFVELRIYDITGDLVHSQRVENSDLKIVNNRYAYEYKWNAAGIASGVYYCRVVAKKSGESDIPVTMKIALVR